MTPEEFRKSIYQKELAAFVNTPTGQAFLDQLVQSVEPEPVDPASPVTAWVAAHERGFGKRQLIQFAISLSLPPETPPEEPAPDWGAQAPTQ